MGKRVIHLGIEVSPAGTLAGRRVRVFSSIWDVATWVNEGERRYYASVDMPPAGQAEERGLTEAEML